MRTGSDCRRGRVAPNRRPSAATFLPRVAAAERTARLAMIEMAMIEIRVAPHRRCGARAVFSGHVGRNGAYGSTFRLRGGSVRPDTSLTLAHGRGYSPLHSRSVSNPPGSALLISGKHVASNGLVQCSVAVVLCGAPQRNRGAFATQQRTQSPHRHAVVHGRPFPGNPRR